MKATAFIGATNGATDIIMSMVIATATMRMDAGITAAAAYGISIKVTIMTTVIIVATIIAATIMAA